MEANEKRQVAVMCEPALYAAIKADADKAGAKVGPHAAAKLRKIYRVGPYERVAVACPPPRVDAAKQDEEVQG